MKDWSEIQREMDERWDKLRKEQAEAHEKFMKDFQDKIDRQDVSLQRNKKLSREAIYKTIFIATGTIAFSVTLASTTALRLNVDEGTLKNSWVMLVFAICLGLFVNLFESRADYAIAWRSIQHQDWENKATKGQKLWIWLVTAYIFILKPRSLAFCKIYKSDERKKKMAIFASQVITDLNILKHLFFLLEIIFYVCFVIGLALLASSFK